MSERVFSPRRTARWLLAHSLPNGTQCKVRTDGGGGCIRGRHSWSAASGMTIMRKESGAASQPAAPLSRGLRRPEGRLQARLPAPRGLAKSTRISAAPHWRFRQAERNGTPGKVRPAVGFERTDRGRLHAFGDRFRCNPKKNGLPRNIRPARAFIHQIPFTEAGALTLSPNPAPA